MKGFTTIFVIVLMLLANLNAAGQSEEAKSLLNNVIERMGEKPGLDANFSLSIFYGSELEQEESGQIRLSGDNIELELDKYIYLSDGVSSWTYLKERNEVQINDITEDDFSVYNPLALLNHLFEGGYSYEITNREEQADGSFFSRLDLKPEDRESAYARVSIGIDEKLDLPLNFTLIQKDGYRYFIEMAEIRDLDDDMRFVFDASKYPDVIIEDLRLGN